jgi:hypothetical protein
MIIAAQEISVAGAIQMAIADSIDAVRHKRLALGGSQEAAVDMENLAAHERRSIAQQVQRSGRGILFPPESA